MGSIVTLVIYAALAAGALFAVHSAWSGFKDHIGMPYAQAQLAADQPQIDAAKKAQTVAEGIRDRALGDTAACVSTLGVQNDAIASWKATAERNLAASREAKKQAMKDATAAAPILADLQAKAAAAPKLMACEVELGKAKDVMRETLRARRGLPTPVVVPVAAPAVEPPPALVK